MIPQMRAASEHPGMKLKIPVTKAATARPLAFSSYEILKMILVKSNKIIFNIKNIKKLVFFHYIYLSFRKLKSQFCRINF
jgi:hypothetical protein